MDESREQRRAEHQLMSALTRGSGIAALAVVAFSLPGEAQRPDPTTQAQKREVLSTVLGYRRTHLREIPVDACNVWKVLGEDSSAFHPMSRSLFRGDGFEGCRGQDGEPIFKLHWIRTQGAYVVLAATVYQSGQVITETHKFMIVAGPDSTLVLYHASVEQADFMNAPYRIPDIRMPPGGWVKPPPKREE